VAADAFARAKYDVAEAVIRAVVPISRAQNSRLRLLEARLARIAYDYDRWYAAAAAARADATDPSDRFHATVMVGLAAKRLGKTDEARSVLVEAERRISRYAPAAVGIPVYLLGLDAWEDGAYDRAESLARANISAGANVAESVGLLAWIAVRQERFEAAGATFLEALDRHHAAGEINVRLHARLLHNAANMASETIDLSVDERLRDEYRRVAWTDSLRVERFDTMQCLRFLSLLKGDLEEAAIVARDAIAYAPSDAFVAIGETNAAATSKLLGDERFRHIQLRRAWTVLRAKSWGAADDDARVALTNFAIEAAEVMPAEARQAITLYGSINGRKNPIAGFSGADRRVDAFAAVAAARVAEIVDDRDLAVREYRRALGIWAAIGFRMRAALAALDLRRLTGSDVDAEAIDAALARAPKAWFVAIAADLESPLHQLTPAELTVLLRLLAGKSAKAIAASLERSHFTINNHTRKIFAAFNVNSRAQLLARCVELGITAASVERHAS
jgi:DNA-binding CsgD family transcriptional regulator